MSFTTSIDYDNAANFIFDSSKVDFVGGVAKLRTTNNPSQVFSQDFSNSAGFTFNASNTEFVGGVVRQKNQRPTGAKFYASYTTNENGSWGDGSLVGTLESGATVSGGQLDLTGGGAKRVVYDATSKLTADPQRGTIRIHYRPNYTGNPANNQTIFHVLKTAIDFANQIEIYHDTASAIRMNLRNSAGGVVIAGIAFGTLVMTAGTLYVLELNYDFTGGVQRLFVNGTQQGLSSAYSFTRDSNQSHLQIGSDSGNTNFKVDDFIVFNQVIHTAAHTGELPYVYQETEYLGDIITLPQFTYTFPENIVTFTSMLITSNAYERFTIDSGSGEYYFDGLNWVISNGSFAQSSTAAQLIANIASFTVGNTITYRIYTVAANNQASVDFIQLDYTGRKYDTSDPFITTNAGTYLDALSFFDSVLSIPALTDIHFILNIGNVDKYYDGANWVDSDGSYLESNTLAQIQAQYTSFSTFVSLGVLFKVKVILRSNTGLSTPEITSHTFTYNFFGVPPVEINECIVYSFIEDILQDIPDFTALNAKLYVENSSTINQGGKIFVPFKFSVNYNLAGYAEISVINTVESQKKLTFSIEYIGSDNKVKTVKFPSKVIPDQVSINLATLLATP